jgi:hypothetical protein
MNHPVITKCAARRMALPALLLALAACSHDDRDPQARIELPNLAAGAHAVVVSGDDSASDGTAFVGSKGEAYVALARDSNEASQVVYRRGSGTSAWRRVPQAGGDLQLRGRLDAPQAVAAWAMPTAATAYRARLGELTVAFTLAPDGKLTAGGDGCKLTGKIAGADLAHAARASLAFSGCAANGAADGPSDGPIDGDYDGIVYVDPDAPNAAFRFVVDNGSAVRDFYAYAP